MFIVWSSLRLMCINFCRSLLYVGPVESAGRCVVSTQRRVYVVYWRNFLSHGCARCGMPVSASRGLHPVAVEDGRRVMGGW